MVSTNWLRENVTKRESIPAKVHAVVVWRNEPDSVFSKQMIEQTNYFLVLFLEDLPLPLPNLRIKSTTSAIIIIMARMRRRIPHQVQQPPKLLTRE